MEEHGRKLAGEDKTNENVTIARNVAEDVALIIYTFRNGIEGYFGKSIKIRNKSIHVKVSAFQQERI